MPNVSQKLNKASNDPLVMRFREQGPGLKASDKTKFRRLSEQELKEIFAIACKVGLNDDGRAQATEILDAYDQPSPSVFLDQQYAKWGYATRPSKEADPRFYQPRLDRARIDTLVNLSLGSAKLADIDDAMQIIKHATGYRNPNVTEEGSLDKLKSEDQELYARLVVSAERILKAHGFTDQDKEYCPTPTIAIPGVSEQLETAFRQELAFSGAWAISNLDLSMSIANSSRDSICIPVIPSNDTEAAINYLGFGDDIQAFLGHVRGKVLLDLGSAGNVLAKSLYLLGSDAKVINVNPAMLSPQVLARHGEHLTLENLRFQGREVPKDYAERFKQIDSNETLFCPWTSLKPVANESIDCLIANGSLTQYVRDTKELKQAFKEIVRVLKPGGEARLTPLFYRSVMGDNKRFRLCILKDFKDVLRKSGIAKSCEIREIEFQSRLRPSETYVCMQLIKKN